MKVHDRRVGLLVLAMSATLVFTGATWPLNPLVTRVDRPAGEAPANCNESLAPPPAPRVDVARIPEREIVPVSIPAPPSRSLRSELEAAQTALVRNDRPAFDTHLGNARGILRDYPSGAERTAAEEAVRAFDDAAKIWDAQFESPFFDQSSEAYARANRYPGYAEAVRRGVFTDDADRRFYPAAESRDFVARAAAERLTRLGIHTPTLRARAEYTIPPPAPLSISRTETLTSAPSARRISRPKSRSSSARSTTRRKSSSPPSLAKSGKSVAPAPAASTSPDPSTPAARTTDPAPAAPPVTAPTPVSTASPVAEGISTTDPADVVPADTAITPTDTTSTVPTTTTAAPATPSDTAPATAATPAERRSVIVPALLILIGLGVLIVLFRASK